MSLYDYLLDTYGQNEPILSGEIEYKDYSRPWLYKELKRLCENGEIIRYEKGVYYIPTQTVLGAGLLNPRKVIEKKYISSGENTVGYYSGIAFLNRLGVSTQMPNILEICTNNETAKLRETTVGRQKILLRRARTEVSVQNAAVLSFLEMMNSVAPSFFDDDRKKKVKNYIDKNGISRSDITKYAPVFPDKAMRTMIESEVIYSVAQR